MSEIEVVDVKRWKCLHRCCTRLCSTKALKLPDGSFVAHEPGECAVHGCNFIPCSEDEFKARTTEH